MHLSFISLASLIVIGPQLLGGAVPWTRAMLAAAALLSLVLALYSKRTTLTSHTPTLWTLRALLVAFAWTAFQIVPLPCTWIKNIASRSVHEQLITSYLLERSVPTFCTISGAPLATLDELLIGASVLCAFISSWLLCIRGYRTAILQSIAVSVTFMALVALGHKLGNLQSVWGLYTPIHANTHLLSPLINENHLAGFLSMGVPVVLMLSTSHLYARIPLLIVASLIGATTILTHSRGGVFSLLIGCGCTLWVVLFRGNPSSTTNSLRQTIFLSCCTLAMFGISLYVNAESILAELSNEHPFKKLYVILDAFKFGLDAPWWGIGRGAFRSAFTAYGPHSLRFEHPENALIQRAVEWGWPVTIFVIAGLGFSLIHVLRSGNNNRMAAALALLTLGLHDILDFALEMPAIAILASILLAAAVAPSIRSRKHKQKQRRVPMFRSGIAIAVATTVILSVWLTNIQWVSAAALEYKLPDLAKTDAPSAFYSRIRKAMRLHPLEPAFPLFAGWYATTHNHPQALIWLNRAMQLAPDWSAPHLYAAQWFWNHKKEDQSLLELRAAASRNPLSSSVLLCQWLVANPRLNWKLATPQEAQPRWDFLNSAVSCIPHTAQAASDINQHLIEEYPQDIEPYLRIIIRLRSLGQHEEALTRALALHQRFLKNPQPLKEIAVLQLALSKPRLVLQTLKKIPAYEHSFELIELEAQAYALLRNDKAMRASLTNLRQLAGTSESAIARAMQLRGQLELTLGNVGTAMSVYEEAYRITNSPECLLKIAQLSESLGRDVRALQAYQTLQSYDAYNPAYRDAIQRLSQKKDAQP